MINIVIYNNENPNEFNPPWYESKNPFSCNQYLQNKIVLKKLGYYLIEYLMKSVVLKADEVMFISSITSTVMSTCNKIEFFIISVSLNCIEGSVFNFNNGIDADSIGSHSFTNSNFFICLLRL